ncbi:hypothetical protein PanWU01x14_324400 [Parasponia andersonii]|uniref:Uncharacterized protein n=1 Tax=Parasponia andersonii TaxID=3476 RepID=A0A2P5AK71_PARAD|nr:hypothetical protein PanWU01x14_324400 [Parasponia andersonii]
MEGNKKQANSSSSFTAELFGGNESQSQQHQSTGIFASIFPPPSKACYPTPLILDS